MTPVRGVEHFLNDYLPLADEWGVWDNFLPPSRLIASHHSHSPAELRSLLQPQTDHLMETETPPGSAMTRMVEEASRAATEKMLDSYKRMGIRVTPWMTLAPEPKPRRRKKSTAP